MNEGQVNYEVLEEFLKSAADARSAPPSSGMMTMRTLRYIVSRFPEKKLHASVQDILDNPAFSDDTWIEFFGESMWVIE